MSLASSANPVSPLPTYHPGKPWLGLLATLLVLPWLSPYTAGPTTNAWPWLLSAACAVVLWLFQRRLDARLIASGWRQRQNLKLPT